MQRHRLSKFVFTHTWDNIIALYHSLTTKIVYLKKEPQNLVQFFSKPNSIEEFLRQNIHCCNIDKQIHELVNKKILIPEDFDELSIYKKYLQSRSVVDIWLMYLILTDQCNLMCGYCFIENASNLKCGSHKMSYKTINKAVDLFYSLNGFAPSSKVIFYGGEPMINSEKLLYAFDYIRKKDKKRNVNIQLITNATLVSDKIASGIVKSDVNVSVSIDGSPDIHNQARIFTENRSPTFGKVLEGCRILKKAGLNKITLSITIGKHNVDRLCKEVDWLVNNIGLEVEAVGFNILIDLPDKCNPFAVDIRHATEKMIEAFDSLRMRGIYEDRMMRKLRPFVEGKFHSKDCGAVGNQIVVAPDGRVGPCQGFLALGEYFPCTVDSSAKQIKNNPVFREWANRMPVNISTCFECPAIAICGGGCPYHAYLTNGSIWGMDERMCEHNKLFVDWAVRDLYKGMSAISSKSH